MIIDLCTIRSFSTNILQDAVMLHEFNVVHQRLGERTGILPVTVERGSYVSPKCFGDRNPGSLSFVTNDDLLNELCRRNNVR